jgi:probable H4MPT-linked C1 transfer pathway protein
MSILGWDVGGANIKAAWIPDNAHATPEVIERPFALWREPHRLAGMLSEVADRFGYAHAMAVTMTAELADCFATKRQGVASVLDAFRSAFPDVKPWVFGSDGRFRSIDAARTQPQLIAAANWMASAMLVARTHPDALFLDVGSTTTDIIPIVGGRPAALGRTDTERLRTGELVYTGALRTPVAAVVRWVPYGWRRCRVAAELFAVTADAHLWLGHIQERDYTCETPDGRGRSRRETAARIARIVCADLEILSDDDVTAIARHIARAQAGQIAAAIRQVARQTGSRLARSAVLAGQGTFLARAAAERAGFAAHDLASDLGPAAARATPAAAVAYLLMNTSRSELLRQ